MDDMARHRNGAGRSPASSLLARVCTLVLAAGLLVGCGDHGDADTHPPASPSPASAPGGTSDDASEETSGATGEQTATDDAAGDDDGDEAAEQVVIVVEDFSYALPDSVPAGAEIVVRNMDGVGHTVTADEGDTFDVVVGPGEEVSFTAPSEAGQYPFHCTPHPAMTGTLVVEGDGS